jgi:hypothetical protein
MMANGDPIVTTVSKTGKGLVVKALLEPANDDGATSLGISVRNMLRPANPGDLRMLGIGFSSLCANALAEGEYERITRGA